MKLENITKHAFSIGLFLAMSFLTLPLIAAAQSEIHFVPDVVDQFQKTALRPDGLGFSIGNTHDPSLNKHYQGMARKQGIGTPYLFITRSGNDTPTCVGCSDDPGNLIVVRMGSRDTNGERMRTNRLIRDWIPYFDAGGFQISWTKPPDPLDRVVRIITFDGQNGFPAYRHPGGVQLVDDVLVIPMENRHLSSEPKLSIQFLDVSTPENPVPTSSLTLEAVNYPIVNEIFSASVLGITRVLNPQGPGYRYLMIVTGKNNRELRLFRSLPTGSDGATALKSPSLEWELMKTDICPPLLGPPFPPEAQLLLPPLSGCQSFPENWRTGVDSYQMLNFVRQGNQNGELFLFGGYNSGIGGEGDDILQLFRVNIDQYGNPGTTLLQNLGTKHITSKPVNGHGDSAALSAAAGIYISPSGELILYATEYENDGPFQLLPGVQPGPKTVRFGEWRHRQIVRPDSPTYKPGLQINGFFIVDEGSSVTLSGQGSPPITKAWLQLFEDNGMGLSLAGTLDDDAWLLMDFADYDRDHFDNLDIFDLTTGTDFNNNAGSWRWFAPQGCNMRANSGTPASPGRSKTLVGDGLIHEQSDLDNESSDGNTGNMDDIISSIQIRRNNVDENPFCEDYYNAVIGVSWDFNNDGVFETVGNNALFSASQLDGPSVVNVNARAQHPTDTTALGHSDPLATAIQIRNVPPVITGFELEDDLGLKAGVDVPFVLSFVEYKAKGFFTDAGRPDRQTAVINFGDNTIVQSSGFQQFGDAFGGATGFGQQSHTYKATGDFTFRFDVTDDDGGNASLSKNLHVATPAEIMQWVDSQIDQYLTFYPNSPSASALQKARSKIIGNNNGTAHNGVLHKIASGELVAALAILKQAVQEIEKAEQTGGGTNFSQWKYYLCLSAESLARKAYLDAVASIGTPTASQTIKLERIRNSISNGRVRLLNSQYVSSVDYFKDALAQTSSL